jgi:hypothetical protein
VIDLEDDDPDIIEKLIQFLYTQQYDDGQSVGEKTSKRTRRKSGKAPAVTDASQSKRKAAQALHINTALYIAGEKYE